ncbi:MAG: nitroreductase family protein [Candidatus Woesearchaeota archaeon]
MYFAPDPHEMEPEESVLLTVYDQNRCLSFVQEKVLSDHIALVLEAGRFSDSAGNLQNWRFIVVERQDKRNVLAQVCRGQDFLAQAPVAIIIVTDEEQALRFYEQEGLRYDLQYAAMAAQNMLTAARLLGYGANYTSAFDREALSEEFGIPETWRVQGVVAFGKPAHTPRFQGRVPIRDLVYLESWGRNIENLDYIMHDVPIVQYLQARAKQVLPPISRAVESGARKARFELLHAELRLKNKQIESLRRDLHSLHERLRIARGLKPTTIVVESEQEAGPWGYYILKNAKGIEYPATREDLAERFEGLEIRDVPIGRILPFVEYPVRSHRELLTKLSAAVKAYESSQ